MANKTIVYAFVGGFFAVGGLGLVFLKSNTIPNTAVQANLSQAVVQQEQPQTQPVQNPNSQIVAPVAAATPVVDVEMTEEQKELATAKKNPNFVPRLGGTAWQWTKKDGTVLSIELKGGDEGKGILVMTSNGVLQKEQKWAMDGTDFVYINDEGTATGNPSMVIKYRKNKGGWFDWDLYFTADGGEYKMEKTQNN